MHIESFLHSRLFNLVNRINCQTLQLPTQYCKCLNLFEVNLFLNWIVCLPVLLLQFVVQKGILEI